MQAGATDRELSIQERLYPNLTCFGCGHANPKGLHLRSYPVVGRGAGTTVAEFRPWPEHDNGFGFLNGGLIATVLVCHSGATVYHGVDVGAIPTDPGPPALFVTAGLDIRYLRPVPLGEALEVRAARVSAQSDLVIVEAELVWGGKPRAVATSEWRPWRPR
jgi:acyl-coenzyme A thioesterase PaaI-like protein